MSLKDRLLNKVADFINKYKIPDYDLITDATISGFVKGAIITNDCTYVKPIEEKSSKGLMSVKDLLEKTLGDSRFNTISFCEDRKVICINNGSNNSYVETVHECLDMAQENTYVICDTKEAFNTFRDFVNQSAKYHIFLEDVEEIPQQKGFEKLFGINQKENKDIEKIIEEKEEQEFDINKNYVQIDGRIKKVGKEFTKKDGIKAKFIDIEQNYEYNNKIKKNNISIMLEGEVFNKYSEQVSLGDKISLTGTLSTYTDRNRQTQSVINCFDLEILSKNQMKGAERL